MPILKSSRARIQAALGGGQPTAIPFADTFTDVDGKLLTAHAADTNPLKKSWLTDGASFTIVGNKSVAKSGTNGDVFTNVVDLGAAEVEMAATVTVNNSTHVYINGLIFRYVDADNYLYASIRYSQGLGVYKVEGGVTTELNYHNRVGPFVLGIPIGVALGAVYKLKIRAAGSSIRVTLSDGVGEGVTIIYESSFNLTATKHGFIGTNRTNGTDSTKIDNLTVVPIPGLVYGDPLVWYHADYGVRNAAMADTLDGQAVQGWNDLGDRGHSGVTFATGAPVFRAGQWDGRNVIQFTEGQRAFNYRAPFSRHGGVTVAVVFAMLPAGPDNYTDLYRIISTMGNDADRIWCRLYHNPMYLAIIYYTNGANKYFCTVDPFAADGAWHILAQTIDFAAGTSLVRYDRAPLNTYAALPKMTGDGALGGVGQGYDAYTSNAYVREFRIYDRAMSAAQLQALEGEMWPG